MRSCSQGKGEAERSWRSKIKLGTGFETIVSCMDHKMARASRLRGKSQEHLFCLHVCSTHFTPLQSKKKSKILRQDFILSFPNHSIPLICSSNWLIQPNMLSKECWYQDRKEIEARRVHLELFQKFCSSARVVETCYSYFHPTRQHSSAFRSLSLILTPPASEVPRHSSLGR